MQTHDFFRFLLNFVLASLASTCCTSDPDPKEICVQKVGPYARPSKPSCFFDPFDNDKVQTPQTSSLTWEQARNVCTSLNASLPLLFSIYGTRLLREAYILRGRFWLALQKNSSGIHDFVDVPENNRSAWVPEIDTFTNWARLEPNNAGCAEECAYMNYDGMWNDYACNFIAKFDKCTDVIYTVCHDTRRRECITIHPPVPEPLATDWYIILAITFGGIFGVVTLIVSVRFIVEQCSELRK